MTKFKRKVLDGMFLQKNSISTELLLYFKRLL